jgi:hypothetical protein
MCAMVSMKVVQVYREAWRADERLERRLGGHAANVWELVDVYRTRRLR